MNGEATGDGPVTREGRWACAYRIGTQLLAAAIVLQFLLAGMGIFGSAQSMFLHTVVNASLIFFGSLIVLACGWRAGAGRADLRLVGAIPALVVLQSILLVPYRMGAPAPLRAISGLHVVNALAIFWVATLLLRRLPRKTPA